MDRHETDILSQRLNRAESHPRNDLILRAMRGEHTERTPVWLMRQAGRFDPAYRELRASAGLELEQLFAHSEYAAKITELPVRFGVDAAILFQDILTILGPMGAPFVFRPGPVLEHPVRSSAAADGLVGYDPHEHLDFVAESIAMALDRLDDAIPLLGFAGAPLTLLAFLVEGASPQDNALKAREFIRDHREAAERLLDRITVLTADYLKMQIDVGVHGVQLFESCASSFSRDEYSELALPYQQEIFRLIGQDNNCVPRVLFARDVEPALMAASGADVISISHNISLADAQGAMVCGAVQGNVDNQLLLQGSPNEVFDAACKCIQEGGHHGHVLNLGHGVLQGTSVSNFCAMIEAAHKYVIKDEVGV